MGKDRDRPSLRPLVPIAEEPGKPFADRVVSLWPRRSTAPTATWSRDEMERVMQVPGWKNVTTQPIINRIEMLSTGVGNDVGVKVFGRDLATIDWASQEVAAALEPLKRERMACWPGRFAARTTWKCRSTATEPHAMA